MEGPEQKVWKIERLLRRGGAVYSVVPVKIRSRLLLLKAFKSQLSGAVTAGAKPAVDVQAALGQGLGTYGREDLEGLFERMSCHMDVLQMILESIKLAMISSKPRATTCTNCPSFSHGLKLA